MNYTEIEIDWMKELLKENELEIWRLRKEIKNLKEERDFFKEQATLWRRRKGQILCWMAFKT